MLLVLPNPGFILNPCLWSDHFTCESDKRCNVQECLIKSVCLECSSSFTNSMIQIGLPHYLQHHLYLFCFACTFWNCSLLAVYTFPSLQGSWFKSWYHIIIIICIELILLCNVPTLWNCSPTFFLHYTFSLFRWKLCRAMLFQATLPSCVWSLLQL